MRPRRGSRKRWLTRFTITTCQRAVRVPIPRSLVGRLASLADRLTTLGGMFRIGLMPTGSKDPLALRRAAFGTIRIVLEGSLAISLDQLVEFASAGANAPKLRDFFMDRLRFW